MAGRDRETSARNRRVDRGGPATHRLDGPQRERGQAVTRQRRDEQAEYAAQHQLAQQPVERLFPLIERARDHEGRLPSLRAGGRGQDPPLALQPGNRFAGQPRVPLQDIVEDDSADDRAEAGGRRAQNPAAGARSCPTVPLGRVPVDDAVPVLGARGRLDRLAAEPLVDGERSVLPTRR